MKKLRLRRWVKVVLLSISIISLFIMASDCEDMAKFVIGHLIACGTFSLSTSILIKFGGEING